MAEGVETLQRRLENVELITKTRIEGDSVHFDLPGGDPELAKVSRALHPVKSEISHIYFKATKGEVQ